MKKRIAIIGAGIAGITVAKAVQDIADVIIFEKSRGLGGRMAQRRRTGYAFDHGAQYFSLRIHKGQALLRRGHRQFQAFQPQARLLLIRPPGGSAISAYRA